MESVEERTRDEAVGTRHEERPADLPAEPGGEGYGESSRRQVVAAVVVGLGLSALYLAYVAYHAVDVPYFDDWFRIPLIHAARHGHLTLGALWAQYNETRIFLGNVVFVAFGVLFHDDLRSLMIFNALIYVATFWAFLLLLRAYLRRMPDVLAVLSCGVVWFSLAQVENSIWAFQVHWVLVPLSFILMSYALVVPGRRRNLMVAVGIVAAVAGSTAMVDGFILWPLGLLCILWMRHWDRRTAVESAVWIGAAALTAGLYSIGFDFKTKACGPGGCSASVALHAPALTTRFFFTLEGNVFPSLKMGHQELYGVLIFAAAVFVVVRSALERRRTIRPPIPILLIGFGLFWDTMIAIGRSFWGVNEALGTRFVLPNLMVLLGIVVFGLAHVPERHTMRTRSMTGQRLVWLGLVAIAAVLVVQLVASTTFGLSNSAARAAGARSNARIFANFDKIPPGRWACELSQVMYYGFYPPSQALAQGLPLLREARQDQLSLFQPGELRQLRAKGLPPIGC
jgi:hypothetical protein